MEFKLFSFIDFLKEFNEVVENTKRKYLKELPSLIEVSNYNTFEIEDLKEVLINRKDLANQLVEYAKGLIQLAITINQNTIDYQKRLEQVTPREFDLIKDKLFEADKGDVFKIKTHEFEGTFYDSIVS